jgi:hypothetical protein
VNRHAKEVLEAFKYRDGVRNALVLSQGLQADFIGAASQKTSPAASARLPLPGALLESGEQ